MAEDESIALHAGATRYPLVVFGDHRFCAGQRLEVRPMSAPHMHSQVEINFVLEGRITYWMGGRNLQISEGQLCLFWGMVPHQVTAVAKPTNFVCLYVPMSVLVNLHSMHQFRDAVFRGSLIEALNTPNYDRDLFLRWREDLLSGNPELEQIVKEELVARIKRVARDGWRDLREQASAIASSRSLDKSRLPKVETMLRYIAEHAHGSIRVEDIGSAAGLHPNYAMALFKKTVGLTLNQAITQHRLDTAQSLLISSETPINSVAFESGFGSVSRFYEAFERRFSMTPARYRNDYLRGNT